MRKRKWRSESVGGSHNQEDYVSANFMEKIDNHVVIKWQQGSNIAYFVKKGEDPDMDPRLSRSGC